MKNSLFTIILILSVKLFGQNQFPTSVTWKYIKTDNFKVIFPKESEIPAQKAINFLERSKTTVDSSLKTVSKPIPVLLNNKSVISNGFVSLAPRYMSWYLTPPQDATSSLDGTDWFYLLSIHEQRHVSQFDKMDEKFTDFLSDLFGDYGRVAAALMTPAWYYEGDAVCAETYNTLTGRGRMPAFLRDNLVLEDMDKRYSYNKASLGSYKNYTPNHYQYGYLMVDHVNRNYGTGTWVNILERDSKFSISPFRFSRSLKKYTGHNLRKTYNNTLNEFDSIWTSELSDVKNIRHEVVVKNNALNTRAHYIFPQNIGNDTVFAVKYGFSFLPTLVLLHDGKEEKLKEINYIDRVQTNGKYAVWNQEFYHVRWGELTFSDIMCIDLKTKETRRITVDQKLFAPALSPDYKKIAAIEYSEPGECSLVIVDFQSGKIIRRIKADEDEMLRMPSWDITSEFIVLTATKGQDKKIKVIDWGNEKVAYSQNFGTENITNPVIFKNEVLFNSPLTGKDQIQAVNMQTGERTLIIDSKYGVYNPHVNEQGKIVFQEYSNSGYYVCTENINSTEKQKIESDITPHQNYLYRLNPVNQNIISPHHQKDTVYEVKGYNTFLNSFFIHSWHPTAGYRRIGAKAFSQDILNNLALVAGLDYYPYDMAHREYLTLSYAKFFPIFNVEISVGKKYEYQEDYNDYYDIDERIVNMGLTVPLDLSNGLFTTNLSLSSGVFAGHQHNNSLDDSINYINDFVIRSPYFYAGFSRTKQYRYKDINPRFGQELSLMHINSSFGSTLDDGRTTVKSTFYFPGIFPHHSLALNAGTEFRQNKNIDGVYLLDTRLKNVRGYDEYNFDNLQRLTIDYSFPFLYPDFGIGGLIYFKRVHSSIFFDQAIYRTGGTTFKPASYGIDMNIEFNLCRVAFPFEIGVRMARRIEDDNIRIEILIFRESF